MSSSIHAELGIVQSEPMVTVEFHFMEKAIDETPVRRPSLVRSPLSVQRTLSNRLGGAQSFSAQDSPLLGTAFASTALAHSTSLEFANNSRLASKFADIRAKADAQKEVEHADFSTEPSPKQSLAHADRPPVVDMSITEEPPPVVASRTLQPASPIPGRQNPLARIRSNHRPSSSLESFQTQNPSSDDMVSISDDGSPVTAKSILPSPLVLPQSSSSATTTNSSALGNTFALPSRSQSLADRLRSSRLLSSTRPGKRNPDDSAMSTGGSLALLGPSRQLAGMAAGLSALPTDSFLSPINAASLASAVAVAGATGSWREVTVHETGSDDSSGKGEVTGKVQTSHEPPMHHIPPAVCVAAGKPGTYTALSQPRRSDTSNLGLFRLFRQRKKRFRSVGAEKFYYLEHVNSSGEFDTISTEGYYRILQDSETATHDSSPPS